MPRWQFGAKTSPESASVVCLIPVFTSCSLSSPSSWGFRCWGCYEDGRARYESWNVNERSATRFSGYTPNCKAPSEWTTQRFKCPPCEIYTLSGEHEINSRGISHHVPGLCFSLTSGMDSRWHRAGKHTRKGARSGVVAEMWVGCFQEVDGLQIKMLRSESQRHDRYFPFLRVWLLNDRWCCERVLVSWRAAEQAHALHPSTVTGESAVTHAASVL